MLNEAGRLVASTREGYLLDLELVPGSYTVAFEELETCFTPEPIEIEVKPHEISGPMLGEYATATGSVVVRYDTGSQGERLDEVRFWITDEEGHRTRYPVEGESHPSELVRDVVLSDLPVGHYELEFTVPNADGLFADSGVHHFEVKKNSRDLIAETIRPRYGQIMASVAPPRRALAVGAEDEGNWNDSYLTAGTQNVPSFEGGQPRVALFDEDGSLVASSEDGELVLDAVKPGNYTIAFEDRPEFAKPDRIPVHIGYDEVIGPFHWDYQPAEGALIVNYGTGGAREYLDAISFDLIAPDGSVHSYPDNGGFIETEGPANRQVSLSQLPIGEYRVQFHVPNDDHLFAEPEDSLAIVARDRVTEVEAVFEPRYASLSVTSTFEKPERSEGLVPTISLTDQSGRIRAMSHSGDLSIENLAPGDYYLTFSDLENYYTPDTRLIHVEPSEDIGPLVGQYEIGRGDLVVAYKTGVKRERMDRVRFWLVDEEGERTMFPREGDYADNPETGYREVTVRGLPMGVYDVEWVLPNRDGLFDDASDSPVLVRKDETVDIVQSFDPHYGSLEVARYMEMELDDEPKPSIWLTDAFGDIIAKVEEESSLIDDLLPGRYNLVFTQTPGYNTPEPVSVEVMSRQSTGPIVAEYTRQLVTLQVRTNDDTRAWTLLKNGEEVTSGAGSYNRILVPPGDGYYFETEKAQGYEVQVEPKGTFTVPPGQTSQAEIRFDRQFGTIDFQAQVEDGEIVTIVLTPEFGNDEIRKSLTSENGRIHWRAANIPTGTYHMEVSLPDLYQESATSLVEIQSGDPLELKPRFESKRQIHIESNVSEAVYELHSMRDGTLYRGEGSEVAFRNLLPGKYEVVFTAKGRSNLVGPQNRVVELTAGEDISLLANYYRAAQLLLSANVDTFDVRIQSLDDEELVFEETIESSNGNLTLPEGNYRIDYAPLKGSVAARYGGVYPDPVEIRLSAKHPKRIRAEYEAQQGSLVVTTNLPGASYTVSDLSEGEDLLVGHFQGDYTVIPMTYIGTYAIDFDEVPNYETPERLIVEVTAQERKTVGGNFIPQQAMAKIAAGAAIVGDVFGEGADDEKPARTVDIDDYTIAVYEVTNEQYAAWLNKAIREDKVRYHEYGAKKGQVTDASGTLYCETVESDSDSELYSKFSQGGWTFFAVEGRGGHPVTQVSWYGAEAYCKDQGYRLPTEAEWEKAASVVTSALDNQIKKFRYGCSCDDIDRSLANYLDSYDRSKQQKAGKSEVGFYNGINLVGSLDRDSGTESAKSPHGLYDMSGNVREWTADWYDPEFLKKATDHNPTGPGHGSRKVTKGGCYDSFAYEIRASARMPQPPEATNKYTGFRVVLDGQAR